MRAKRIAPFVALAVAVVIAGLFVVLLGSDPNDGETADTNLLGAPAPIYLLLQRQGSAPIPDGSAVRDYARHWTPLHLDFVVPDIGAAIERALAAGARLERGTTEHAYGKLALLADPFGHGVCLLQFNARGYDAIATG